MTIVALLHAEFEEPGIIKEWFLNRGHDFKEIRLYAGDKLPEYDFQMIIVMGGPMNIYEEEKFNWLKSEKMFLRNAVETGKKVLGICLGAQLIADVLGGKVFPNNKKEIGWYNVKRENGFSKSNFFNEFPETLKVFQWHGDTFEIPPLCKKTAFSDGCGNQAFEFGDKVLALQFHMEADLNMVKRMIENCGDEISDGEYIQSEGEMIIETKKNSVDSNYWMIKILEKFEEVEIK